MLDGATSMDPGVNRPASRVSVEAIAEVTRGDLGLPGRIRPLERPADQRRDQERHATGSTARSTTSSATRKWNANSQTNILNGDPKPFQDERDWGFAIGGPVGKPGGNNKLFFYFNHELNPRNFGNNVTRYRMPTALERAGRLLAVDRQSRQPVPLHQGSAARRRLQRDDTGGLLQPTAACSAGFRRTASISPGSTSSSGGRSRTSRTSRPARPTTTKSPTRRSTCSATSRSSGSTTSRSQPARQLQVPRVSAAERRHHRHRFPGSTTPARTTTASAIPAGTVNWTVNSTTFVEASLGANFHHQEGCSVAGGSPNFCRSGLPVNDIANRNNAGFGGIPYLFPDATILDPETFSYEVRVAQRPADLGRHARARRAGVHLGQPRATQRAAEHPGAVQQLHPRHAGVQPERQPDARSRAATRSRRATTTSRATSAAARARFLGSINFQNDTNNPLDSGFGFANAALGVFSSYSQLSRWGEGAYTAINHEAYIQDNWKLKRQPHARLRRAVRPPGAAVRRATARARTSCPSSGRRRRRRCSTSPAAPTACHPCTGTNRQAMNPLTGQFLGPNSAARDRHARAQHRQPDQRRLRRRARASPRPTTSIRRSQIAPRVGAAWDVQRQPEVRRARQRRPVLRSPAGAERLQHGQQPAVLAQRDRALRPAAGSEQRRPHHRSAAGADRLAVRRAAAELDAVEHGRADGDAVQHRARRRLHRAAQLRIPAARPTSTPSISARRSCPQNSGPDADQHHAGCGLDRRAQSRSGALLPRLRQHLGQQQAIQWRTYHSIQLSLQSAAASTASRSGSPTRSGSTIASTVALRLQHNADGTVTVRGDQAKADELLGNNNPQAHIMRANFVWQLPTLDASARRDDGRSGTSSTTGVCRASGPARPASAYTRQLRPTRATART